MAAWPELRTDEESAALGSEREDSVGVAVLVLIAALTAVAVAQGGFYAPGRYLVGVGVTLSSILAFRNGSVSSIAVRRLIMAAVAVTGWAIVRSVAGDQIQAGLTSAAAFAAMGGVVLVCWSANAAERNALVCTLLAIGAALALSGWVGVAWRVEPWAMPSGTMWRASSTLTYPNGAAAVLVAAVLLALARQTARAPSAGPAALSCVLLAGIAATQSRGGAIALAAGLLTLTSFVGLRQLGAVILGPAAGAAVALAGAVPGLGVERSARPELAIAALAIGMALAACSTRLRPRRLAALSIGGAVITLAVLTVTISMSGGLRTLPTDRLSLTSADRTQALTAAFGVFRHHLLVGVGPGNLSLIWARQGEVVTTQLVHNEYLQFATELGVVGISLLAALGLAAIQLIRSARTRTEPWLWSGVIAGLIAIAVHSNFDFLWHIPAVALFGAALFGLAAGGPVVQPGEPDPIMKERTKE